MNWKKVILIILDTVLAVYLLFAVTSFNRLDDKAIVCSQVKIEIKDDVVNGFLNADEIKRLLVRQNAYPLAKPMADIDVRHIEEVLKTNPFISDAQSYKTQSGFVIISLAQRTPVLHIKADTGDDYYIDSKGGYMANMKYCSDIIVATGNINRRYASKVLAKVGNAILADKFWQNQIEQLHVLADGTIEMAPRVGEHIVYLGQPVDIGKKLHRLEMFYRYGLSQAGWNKYSHIHMAFDNQIICKKKQHNNSTI